MKILLQAFTIGLYSIWNWSVVGGEFINLDFEAADLTGSVIEHRTLVTGDNPVPTAYPFGYGPIDKLLPGWQVAILGDPTSPTYPDQAFLGNGAPMLGDEAPQVGLMLQGDKIPPMFGRNPDGRFALLLYSSTTDPIIRLSQIGQVPLDARVLKFTDFNLGPFSLNINDRGYFIGAQTPELILDSHRGVFREWSFDISPWAGETIDLGFTVFGNDFFGGFDSIRFVVPEPSSVLLGMFAAALFLIFRKIKKRPASAALMN